MDDGKASTRAVVFRADLPEHLQGSWGSFFRAEPPASSGSPRKQRGADGSPAKRSGSMSDPYDAALRTSWQTFWRSAVRGGGSSGVGGSGMAPAMRREEAEKEDDDVRIDDGEYTTTPMRTAVVLVNESLCEDGEEEGAPLERGRSASPEPGQPPARRSSLSRLKKSFQGLFLPMDEEEGGGPQAAPGPLSAGEKQQSAQPQPAAPLQPPQQAGDSGKRGPEARPLIRRAPRQRRRQGATPWAEVLLGHAAIRGMWVPRRAADPRLILPELLAWMPRDAAKADDIARAALVGLVGCDADDWAAGAEEREREARAAAEARRKMEALRRAQAIEAEVKASADSRVRLGIEKPAPPPPPPEPFPAESAPRPAQLGPERAQRPSPPAAPAAPAPPAASGSARSRSPSPASEGARALPRRPRPADAAAPQAAAPHPGRRPPRPLCAHAAPAAPRPAGKAAGGGGRVSPAGAGRGAFALLPEELASDLLDWPPPLFPPRTDVDSYRRPHPALLRPLAFPGARVRIRPVLPPQTLSAVTRGALSEEAAYLQQAVAIVRGLAGQAGSPRGAPLEAFAVKRLLAPPAGALHREFDLEIFAPAPRFVLPAPFPACFLPPWFPALPPSPASPRLEAAPEFPAPPLALAPKALPLEGPRRPSLSASKPASAGPPHGFAHAASTERAAAPPRPYSTPRARAPGRRPSLSPQPPSALAAAPPSLTLSCARGRPASGPAPSGRLRAPLGPFPPGKLAGGQAPRPARSLSARGEAAALAPFGPLVSSARGAHSPTPPLAPAPPPAPISTRAEAWLAERAALLSARPLSRPVGLGGAL
eukprot:tig00001373_g8443.t1